jgi:hypothetical protein
MINPGYTPHIVIRQQYLLVDTPIHRVFDKGLTAEVRIEPRIKKVAILLIQFVVSGGPIVDKLLSPADHGAEITHTTSVIGTDTRQLCKL